MLGSDGFERVDDRLLGLGLDHCGTSIHTKKKRGRNPTSFNYNFICKQTIPIPAQTCNHNTNPQVSVSTGSPQEMDNWVLSQVSLTKKRGDSLRNRPSLLDVSYTRSAYLTTRLTSLPGTQMALTTVLPQATWQRRPRRQLHLLVGGVAGDVDAATDLAEHLYDDLHRVLDGLGQVKLGPGGGVGVALTAERLMPQLIGPERQMGARTLTISLATP